MSGHSKWHSIKHQKAVADSRRGAAFTKLANGISLAAREGGPDPDSNFKLRLAIQKGREANMPNENIERAIRRGTGEDKDGAEIKEVVYEGYGPNGVAILVETVTDNTNRTSNDVRSYLTKAGGSLGTSNSVAWQFDIKGVIRISKEKLPTQNTDELQLQLIDAGAEDVREEAEGWTIIAPKESLSKLVEFFSNAKMLPDSQGLEYIPKNTVTPENEPALKKLIEQLEEHDDVQSVYTNAKGF